MGRKMEHETNKSHVYEEERLEETWYTTAFDAHGIKIAL